MRSVTVATIALMLNIGMTSSDVISEEVEQSWQKIREAHGVVVYTQEVEGSDIIKVKAQVVINVNMEKIQLFLDNISYRKKWVPYLEDVKILKEYSATERLEYSFFVAPWPASNRDFIYRQRLLHKDDKKIVFALNVEESDLMPEQDGIVRAEMIESQYTLTLLTDNQTKAELIFYADPKGLLPNWVINMTQKELPYRMLRKLKVNVERLERKK